MSQANLTGYEPSLGGQAGRSPLTGLEPVLGGDKRFDPQIWMKLIDPRWTSKETLITEMPLAACELYAQLLIQALPHGSILNEKLNDGSLLTSHLATEQRAAAAYTLGLIGARAGAPLASSFVTPLAACFNSVDEEIVQTEAALGLGLLNDTRIEPILLKGFSTGGWRLRLAVIHSLGGVGGLETLEFLTRLIHQSESLNEVAAALESLAVLGNRLDGAHRRAIFDLLVRVFVRGDNLQRGAAARALGLLGERDGLDIVIQTVIHGRGDLQCAAVQALGMFGDSQAVPPLIVVLTSGAYHARQDAVNSLIRIGQTAIAPVMAVLRHPEPAVRQGAVEVLGKVGASNARRALVERLNDPSPAVRRATVSAIGMIRGDWAVDLLISVLEDADPGVRKEAAMMLSSFPDERSVGPLCVALWDADMMVRWFAAYALGVHRDARAIPSLCQALMDRSQNVVNTAADSLVKIGDLAVPALVGQARSGDPSLRRAAIDLVERIGTPLARAVLDDLSLQLRIDLYGTNGGTST